MALARASCFRGAFFILYYLPSSVRFGSVGASAYFG